VGDGLVGERPPPASIGPAGMIEPAGVAEAVPVGVPAVTAGLAAVVDAAGHRDPRTGPDGGPDARPAGSDDGTARDPDGTARASGRDYTRSSSADDRRQPGGPRRDPHR